jgi:type II secretory pathway pseudopilin PulG
MLKQPKGHILVEVLLAMSLFVVIASAILGGFVSARDGKVNQQQSLVAKGYLDRAVEALRSVRERDWKLVSTNGVFHPNLNGSTWELLPNQGPDIDGFRTQIVIGDVLRSSADPFGNVVPAGDAVDPASKKAAITVSWGPLDRQKVELGYYLSRSEENSALVHTTDGDFASGNNSGTHVVNNQGGEVILANNNRARWCSPSLSSSSIDLPDGPPVAVAARSSSVSATIPNDILTATAPESGSSIKLAYVNVTADAETPTASLRGIFTLDPSKGTIQTGIGLDNNFKTNDVKYYTAASGKLYALIATDKPDKEVIAILVNDNNDSSNSEYQDFTHKIYKYWTFFNTRIYQGNNSSTPNQDQAPFGYGAVSLAVYGDRGYILSGGYLYVFNLANIDSKTPSSGLDMVGCRIQLDGYECNPGSGTDKKYSAGQTGSSWGDTTPPAHDDCSDGGNIELYADNDLDVVKVGTSTYAFVAVGAGTNPEFNIANVTSVPTSSTSPRISSSSCGRISGGSSGWRRVGSLDFNDDSGTEEAANSVYANSEGTRAYISSNGGIDSSRPPDGKPDSYQLYVIDTSSKTAPKFLSGTSSPPTNGYYYGQNTTEENKQLYPRRSLTVLNGERAVLVGKDGVDDSNNAQEYQVLKMEGSDGEKNPQYCGGVNFDSGFNDLVSVVEADSDSFVYMVANTQEKQLKIIQGGEDGTYMPSGVFESEVFDAGPNKTVMFNRIDADVSLPSGTALDFQVVTYGDGTQACGSLPTPSYFGPDGTVDSKFTAGGPIPYHNLPSTNINPARCFKYKVSLYSDTSRDKTPVLNSLQVNYSP